MNERFSMAEGQDIDNMQRVHRTCLKGAANNCCEGRGLALGEAEAHGSCQDQPLGPRGSRWRAHYAADLVQLICLQHMQANKSLTFSPKILGGRKSTILGPSLQDISTATPETQRHRVSGLVTTMCLGFSHQLILLNGFETTTVLSMICTVMSRRSEARQGLSLKSKHHYSGLLEICTSR